LKPARLKAVYSDARLVESKGKWDPWAVSGPKLASVPICELLPLPCWTSPIELLVAIELVFGGTRFNDALPIVDMVSDLVRDGSEELGCAHRRGITDNAVTSRLIRDHMTLRAEQVEFRCHPGL